MLAFFFFNDTATTEIYTLSLHDALPISEIAQRLPEWIQAARGVQGAAGCQDTNPRNLRSRHPAAPWTPRAAWIRSEEHTSELQSHLNLVCRLLLAKNNSTPRQSTTTLHK